MSNPQSHEELAKVTEKLLARNLELEALLSERTAQLGVRTKQLGTRTDELGERTEQLGARMDELGSQISQLGERTAQLSAKTKEFDTSEAINLGLEGQLGERTAQLGERTAQLGVRTVELGSQTTRLGERTAQLSAKTKEFDTSEAINLGLEGQLGERTAQLGVRTRQLGTRTEQLGSQTTQLGERTAQLSAKTKEFNTSEAYNVELEGQLGERTAQLGIKTDELGSQTTQLGERTTQLTAKTEKFHNSEAHNVELESQLNVQTQQLLERTKQLEELNKELEAFNYAASHDLRAPLRSIDGFSLVLLEDYHDQLDAEGQSHLKRIRTCAQRMGQLIDDLIGLSSLNRGSLKRAPCDLSVEIRKISADLRRTAPEREVVFEFPEHMLVNCDLRLMQIVLVNLLGNAFKYSSKIPSAKIEVGSKTTERGIVYFVRDNGAGFDMQYVQKLFAPFQRLHSTAEFEGNGIGLATVQRIIHRHGGEVWAKSGVNVGTTISFTLDAADKGTQS